MKAVRALNSLVSSKGTYFGGFWVVARIWGQFSPVHYYSRRPSYLPHFIEIGQPFPLHKIFYLQAR